MTIKIKKYEDEKEYNQLLTLIKSEGKEWEEYLKPNYKKALENSITYLAFVDNKLCGYSRSVNDANLYIWIVDLLVHKNYRGNAIGNKLMQCLVKEFPNLDILVMSDVDAYYTKLGFKKEGSIFKVE